MTRPPHSPIPLKPVYRPEDIADVSYEKSLNDPGTYPYTRGRRPRQDGIAWIQRELSGEGDPARTNAQFKYLIGKGAMGLDVIGDTPTMALLDPDHPAAAHAVGTQGVSLCRLDDYLALYDGLALDSLTISNSLPPTFAIAGLYVAAKARGIDPARLRGSTVQAPFYCEDCGYATHMPFDLRLRLAADAIDFAGREMPKFHAFLEDTYYISEGGLDAVEEMALGFVEIRHLVKELLRRGLAIDSFAPRIAILVNCRMDFFTEIAKIRATRRLFARMLREEFGAQDPRSLAVNIASHTSGLSLTAQQPINNVVRGTVQALALALAGVQAIEISGFDEAFRTPSPEAHLVGLRTQQIIQLEANVTKVLDPMGGSYFIEALTNEIEQRIRDMVARIESMGDPATLCDNGWFRALFQDTTERYARDLQEGAQVQVGVNALRIPDEEDRLLREVVERKFEPCRERIESIRAFKRGRNQPHVTAALARIRRTCTTRENLMPAVIAAMEAGVTMGEISGVMRTAYGFAYDPFGMMEPPA
ncbi:MAG TPA: methylmalonyl-CoA mutase family protein [Candidatus Binatia bacterium]